jgi:hypothetical protein
MAVLLLSLAAGCATTSPPRTVGPVATQIGACSPSVPRPAPGETYVLTLSGTFQLRDAQVTKSGHSQPANPHPRPDPTRLDIVTDLKAGESATVMLILADPTLSFQAPDRALTGGDAGAAKMFCGLSFNPSGRQLTFTVYYPAGIPTAKYNLGLVVTDTGGGYSLPILIDPDVTNDGFV